MGAARRVMRGGAKWCGAVTVAAIVALAVIAAGGGRASAAGPAVPAGDISTVAGGVGGPAKATTVGVVPAGVAFAGGSLYIADALSVRKVNPNAA